MALLAGPWALLTAAPAARCLMGYVEVMRRVGLSQIRESRSRKRPAGLGSLAEWGMLSVLKLAGPRSRAP